MRKQRIQERSLIGMLITLGVVYGDIGTSPLYVMNALINDAGNLRMQHLIMLSAVFH